MIGYWCRFSRNQDVFHVGLWRLLQAPYASTGAALDRSAVKVTVATSIAELLDRHGAASERILNRYGLYCSGCWRSPAETLASGWRSHGLPEHQIERLLIELERAFAEPESGTVSRRLAGRYRRVFLSSTTRSREVRRALAETLGDGVVRDDAFESPHPSATQHGEQAWVLPESVEHDVEGMIGVDVRPAVREE